MRRILRLMTDVRVLFTFVFVTATSPQAQTQEEKQLIKEHAREMTVFMAKCSKCQSLERILSPKKPMVEWDEVLKIMAGKPHANLRENDLNQIAKWIDFMQSAAVAGP